MGEIKAIETIYNGYRFRSRLEARWAVFFDTLGVKYEYEKQGFETTAGRYLPDFWVPEWNCFWEACGEPPSAEKWEKCNALFEMHIGQGDPKMVYVCIGSIWPGELTILEAGLGWYDPEDPDSSPSPDHDQIVQCACGQYSFLRDGPYELSLSHIGDHDSELCSGGRGVTIYRANDASESKIRSAYIAARQARFEHGQTPKV